MKMLELSVIIPAYNEMSTLEILLTKIQQLNLSNALIKEIIVVNDASTDETDAFMRNYVVSQEGSGFKYISHSVNKGKGAAIMTALKQVSGDYVIIQDADLEYDPQDYNKLITPVNEGFADVSFGSRYLNKKNRGAQLRTYYIANKFLTGFFNFINRTSFTDIHTCYKLLPAALLKQIVLQEQRFGFDPELSSKLVKMKSLRIVEVSISYKARR